MKKLILILSFGLLFSGVSAQLPLLDRGVQLGGLWCFPLHGDTLTYVYLPKQASLAQGENGLPQFSYMRYVLGGAAGGTATGGSTIEEADGGAILNFLVLYHTPEELISNAQGLLRERLKNDSIRIRGPLLFDQGRYSLVSSVLSSDSLVKRSMLLTNGNAPVMQNNNVALSFGLTPLTSKILTQNFHMATPDVSLVFDMELSGLTENYDATLEIDWSEVKTHQSFNAGGTVYFVSADVKLALDELMKSQAIKLTVNGSNSEMEGLLNTVYEKLLGLLFAPVQPESLPERQQNDLAGALSQLIGNGGALSSGNTTGFGLNVGYQLKHLNSTGKSRLYFKGRSTVQRHHFITFNVGDLYKQYGDNEELFADKHLNDSRFLRRTILVGVDGDLEKEFDQMLNSVTVILNKEHGNGEVTTQTALVNKGSLANTQKPALVYGHYDDSTRWLEYRQRTIWQFRGGAVYESGWQTQDAAMINLFVPFVRKAIKLEGNLESLKQQGIRALSVQISYPFFSQQKQERITVSTSDSLQDKAFAITQPAGAEEVNYTITWIRNNGQTIEKTGVDKIGILFVDELPQ
ncbi:MAG: hypothetical protein P0Y53_21365 [Candidatus Pseudobacter hemicellulosilyticus]|uniref:Uncharacterized protein n=1 Tax=Candidatus Pseudobacter hemicellulosilyticus TaxID=3121375 RepID=A0AAJ6BHC5_9BACT|nr:MAG: hypothetical protein P0Y53_21365 [Pseudobacter sp.]